jgi:hypothetical protein
MERVEEFAAEQGFERMSLSTNPLSLPRDKTV